jgi:hypothetical protein
MPQMSKVELYAAIRRDHRAGVTMRELERKYNVAWRTVRRALDSAWPEPRKPLPPRPSALDPYKAVIGGILRADLDAPRKQRHTVTRIFHRLVEEHGANVSYPMVRRYVADRKPQIAVEAGKAPIEAFVPQTHPPGMEAEVDFGDVAVRLAGELVDQDLHRPTSLRGHRRPAHLQRHDHRNRHRLLPPRLHPGPSRGTRQGRLTPAGPQPTARRPHGRRAVKASTSPGCRVVRVLSAFMGTSQEVPRQQRHPDGQKDGRDAPQPGRGAAAGCC